MIAVMHNQPEATVASVTRSTIRFITSSRPRRKRITPSIQNRDQIPSSTPTSTSTQKHSPKRCKTALPKSYKTSHSHHPTTKTGKDTPQSTPSRAKSSNQTPSDNFPSNSATTSSIPRTSRPSCPKRRWTAPSRRKWASTKEKSRPTARSPPK